MRPLLAAALALALFSSSPVRGAEKPEVTVFAAASLADAFNEAAKAFSAAGGARIVFNFAGSNDLARQIEAGAPAQVFVSANREQMERLEKAGKVRPGTAFPLLGNSLVVIVPKESKTKPLAGPRGLLSFDRLALADPAGVPAGIYAREWLERTGVWQQLSPRVVPALDVRAALAAVAAGNLPAGVVYATDAASSDRVRIVYRVPEAEAPEVRYFAAPVVGAPKAAADFLAFLRSPRARPIFLRHGFVFPASGAKTPGS
ncbi:MAG TPA: molybdate ABC transporter substrate-binding protein [Thermoanaerobaculia bacterium]|nr:molybdate ABC transporter substrate-binding protein [Thermoanaerobaculia bacterium]